MDSYRTISFPIFTYPGLDPLTEIPSKVAKFDVSPIATEVDVEVTGEVIVTGAVLDSAS